MMLNFEETYITYNVERSSKLTLDKCRSDGGQFVCGIAGDQCQRLIIVHNAIKICSSLIFMHAFILYFISSPAG